MADKPVSYIKPKGQLKCFQCRKVCPPKEGSWVDWKNMQVFFCKPCDLQTQNHPDRRKK